MGIKFTQTYKKYINAHPAKREIMCLKVIFPHVLEDIRPEDMFAGREKYGPIGFTPEGVGHGPIIDGFMYYCDETLLKNEINSSSDCNELLESLDEIKEFWRFENTKYKVRNAYSEELASALPHDNFAEEPGIAFPLYRMGGIYLNYEKLVKNGIPGMLKEIAKLELEAAKINGDIEIYQAMKMAVELLVDICLYYSDQAKQLGKNDVAEILEKITTSKPENLREAIQLVWIYSILAGAMNYGRMDVFLGDFYTSDIDSGLISKEVALEMISSFWKLMADRNTIWNGRVIIGGLGRNNELNADRFALAAIAATRIVKEIEPQLTLRFYKGMNSELMEKALETIGEGRTYPMLYNDDINVDAVMRAFEISYEEALQYVPFGCGEYVINHKSFGTPSGVINLSKALEAVLFNGLDLESGKVIGLQAGEFNGFETFDDVFDAYKKQVTYLVEALSKQEELEYKIAGENATFLYVSMLFDDCMERGKGIFSGGAQYLGGTLETYGNTNVADSLTAINQLVFVEKCMTLDTMIKALKANFVGYEKEHKMMVDAPKFGNDDLIADEMAKVHHNFVCNIVRKQKKSTKLHSYLAVIINNSTNTTFGHLTNASPDGRRAGQPLANANMPSAGSDKNSITFVMNSQVKLDPTIHAGSVQNMKFSRELFSNSPIIVKALLNTYFSKGGTQAMITVVNKGDLENAMDDPEKYRQLFVRVGGFSARFIELERDIQLEIISRTLY